MARLPLVLSLALLLGTAAACGKADSPATPGGTGPTIREIQPGVILAGPQTQTITISGDNFGSGLSLQIVRPNNQSVTLVAGDLENVTANDFRVALVFDQVGNYGFTVRSASGSNSPNFNLAVQTTASGPRLVSVSPSSTTLSTTPQVLLFNGDSLGAPLTVTMTDPDGFVTIFTNDQLGGVTSTGFQLTFTPSKRGAWSFSASTASGGQSNSVIISVG